MDCSVHILLCFSFCFICEYNAGNQQLMVQALKTHSWYQDKKYKKKQQFTTLRRLSCRLWCQLTASSAASAPAPAPLRPEPRRSANTLPFLIQTVCKALGQNILSPWAASNKLSFHWRARQILPSLRSPPPHPFHPRCTLSYMSTCSGAHTCSAPCGLVKLAHFLYLSINSRVTGGHSTVCKNCWKGQKTEDVARR